MTNNAYIILMSIVAAILLAFFVFICRKKGNLLKTLAMIIGSAFFILLSYIPALFCPDSLSSSIFYSVYFIANTWLCVSIFLFGAIYTGHKVYNKWIRILSCLWVIGDSLSLLCNVFAHHAVIYTYVTSGAVSCWKFQGTWWFQIHLALCYILLAVFFIDIITKIVKAPRLYKTQYIVILAILLVCVIGNGIFLIQSDTIDLSVIFYAFAGLAFYYFALIFLPHQLTGDMGKLILKEMNSALVFFDLNGYCVFANAYSMKYFQAESHKTTLKEFTAALNLDLSELAKSRTVPLNVNGEEKSFLITYQSFEDSRRRYLGCFFRLDDVTAEIKEQQEKMYLATHDRLTGVYNQDTFFREARKFLDAHPDLPCSIITTNVSQFKLINDLLGSDVGDQLLLNIGRIIDSFNDRDVFFGRMDSDRFALCVPSAKKIEVQLEAKIEDFIGGMRASNNLSLAIFNQCGVYEITDRSLSVSAMCDRANIALAAVKGDEERKISYYDTKMFNQMLLENQLLSELPTALKEKQFVLYFQPQVDSLTNRIVGAEALVRWNHPQKGLIPPGIFIPLLERTGHIYELDRYVWAETCRTIKELRTLGYHVPLSVNISPRDIYSADVYQVITSLTEQYGLPASSLNLEITESAVILDMDRMNGILGHLKEKGFRIEMDDFGSGYSSLNTLKDIQVDVLKLDMKFLETIKGSERGEKILAAIVALAKAINAPIIAEGVEDKEQVNFLLGLGCHNLQGYYFSKPIPYDSYLSMLESYQTGLLE
jgi:diguanylate cyclase (GGDEF)-like protein